MLLNLTILPGDGIGPEVTEQAVLVLKPLPTHSAITSAPAQKHRRRGLGSRQRSSARRHNPGVPRFLRSPARRRGQSRLRSLSQPPSPRSRTPPPAPRTRRLRQPASRHLLSRARRLFPAACRSRSRHRHHDRPRVAWRTLFRRTAFYRRRARLPRRHQHHDVRRAGHRAHRPRRLRPGGETPPEVLSVDKANVLECSRLWREVVTRCAKDYPGVQLSHMYVDSAAMSLVSVPKIST
jgi:hypothetical protein